MRSGLAFAGVRFSTILARTTNGGYWVKARQEAGQSICGQLAEKQHGCDGPEV
jgi:hypothetical protein